MSHQLITDFTDHIQQRAAVLRQLGYESQANIIDEQIKSIRTDLAQPPTVYINFDHMNDKDAVNLTEMLKKRMGA